MSNLRILRLTNTNENVVRLSTDKSSFFYKIPEDLVNMGRCVVEVISGSVQITRQPTGQASTSRIVPTNIPVLLVRSNIEQLGTDSYTGGDGNILGTCLLQNTAPASEVLAGSTTQNAVPFSQTSPLTFLCNQLPSEVFVEKLYYTDAVSPVLTPAASYTTNNLPMEVVLKLTFLDME
jgi:hypothetical protein